MLPTQAPARPLDLPADPRSGALQLLSIVHGLSPYDHESARTAHALLPSLCTRLFGTRDRPGWMHLAPGVRDHELPPDAWNALVAALIPDSPLWSVLLAHAGDRRMFVYEMAPGAVPAPSAALLERRDLDALPDMYRDRIAEHASTVPQVMRDRASAGASTSSLTVVFNMAEFFLFHFAQAIVCEPPAYTQAQAQAAANANAAAALANNNSNNNNNAMNRPGPGDASSQFRRRLSSAGSSLSHYLAAAGAPGLSGQTTASSQNTTAAGRYLVQDTQPIPTVAMPARSIYMLLLRAYLAYFLPRPQSFLPQPDTREDPVVNVGPAPFTMHGVGDRGPSQIIPTPQFTTWAKHLLPRYHLGPDGINVFSDQEGAGYFFGGRGNSPTSATTANNAHDLPPTTPISAMAGQDRAWASARLGASKFFLGSLSEWWLGQYELPGLLARVEAIYATLMGSADLTAMSNELAADLNELTMLAPMVSKDVLRGVEALIQHLSGPYLLQALQSAVSEQGLGMSRFAVDDRDPDRLAVMAFKSAYHTLVPQLYRFLTAAIATYPLDTRSSQTLWQRLITVWTTYIQPIPPQNLDLVREEEAHQLETFVTANLSFYTTLLGVFLVRVARDFPLGYPTALPGARPNARLPGWVGEIDRVSHVLSIFLVGGDMDPANLAAAAAGVPAPTMAQQAEPSTYLDLVLQLESILRDAARPAAAAAPMSAVIGGGRSNAAMAAVRHRAKIADNIVAGLAWVHGQSAASVRRAWRPVLIAEREGLAGTWRAIIDEALVGFFVRSWSIDSAAANRAMAAALNKTGSPTTTAALMAAQSPSKRSPSGSDQEGEGAVVNGEDPFPMPPGQQSESNGASGWASAVALSTKNLLKRASTLVSMPAHAVGGSSGSTPTSMLPPGTTAAQLEMEAAALSDLVSVFDQVLGVSEAEAASAWARAAAKTTEMIQSGQLKQRLGLSGTTSAASAGSRWFLGGGNSSNRLGNGNGTGGLQGASAAEGYGYAATSVRPDAVSMLDSLHLSDVGREQVLSGTRKCPPVPTLSAGSLGRHLYLTREVPPVVDATYAVADWVVAQLARAERVARARHSAAHLHLVRLVDGASSSSSRSSWIANTTAAVQRLPTVAHVAACAAAVDALAAARMRFGLRWLADRLLLAWLTGIMWVAWSLTFGLAWIPLAIAAATAGVVLFYPFSMEPKSLEQTRAARHAASILASTLGALVLVWVVLALPYVAVLLIGAVVVVAQYGLMPMGIGRLSSSTSLAGGNGLTDGADWGDQVGMTRSRSPSPSGGRGRRSPSPLSAGKRVHQYGNVVE
ncbi:hypothetical protein BC828DRAFT_380410 [Blastocladiella britannica]|nr:hypothetical protein BC828DRAFT_380410 [Blastocladiella britannica]